MDNEKALDLALGQITKQFGEGAVMKMGEKVNIEFLRDQLDKALSDIEDLKDKVRANGSGAH